MSVEGAEDGHPVARGYAYSGGGKGIVRVDVSVDGGKTWDIATLKHGGFKHGDYTRTWTWALWEYEVPQEVVKGKGELELVVKATDTTYNVQPPSIEPFWNLRGVCSNAWSRVTVKLPKEEPQAA